MSLIKSKNSSAYSLAQLLEATARLIYNERGPRAIHPGQWSVLRFLANTTENKRDLNGVAAYLGVTQGPASRALAALEAKKLVIGHVQKMDKRKRTMTLTDAGKAALEQDPILQVTDIISALEPEQQAVLEAALTQISAQLVKLNH